MQYLLQILKEEGVNVPDSVYKLKKEKSAQKCLILKTISQGQYAFFSIKETIELMLKKSLLTISEKFSEIRITLSVDGLPLFKSSPVSLWPILMNISNANAKYPLPLCVFAGVGKPDYTIFTERLVAELKLFKTFQMFGNKYIKISNCSIICDFHARAFLQQVKGHSSYAACPYCRIERNSMLLDF